MQFEETPVLVVEDREENRRTAAEFFATINIPVVFATCFTQAKKLLESTQIFRACIFDVELPEIDADKPTPHHNELYKLGYQTYNSAFIFVTGGWGHGFDGSYINAFAYCFDAMFTQDPQSYWGGHYEYFFPKDKTSVETWQHAWDKLNEIVGDRVQVLTETKIEIQESRSGVNCR